MAPEPKPPMRQIAELIDSIATARAESAERLLGECETQLIETRAQIERVKALLDSALSDCIDRDAEIARLRDEITHANTERENALADNRRLRDSADAMARALQEAHERDVRLTADLDTAAAGRRSAYSEVERLCVVAADFGSQRDKARKDVADRDAEIARLKTVLANRDAECDAEIEWLKSKLEETRADLAGLECAMAATTEQRGGYVTTAAPPADDPRIAALCRLTHSAWNGNPAAYTAEIREADILAISGPMRELVGRR